MGTPLQRRIAAAAICVFAASAIVYLALNDPETSPAPRCLFNAITGYDCPGCGSQRAIHALLQGRVADAWRYNAAMFFAVPLAVMYVVAPRRWDKVIYSMWFALGIVVAFIFWWVYRNV